MNRFVPICVFFLGLFSVVISERPSVCPFGYGQVERKCYKILDISMNFFEATTACDVIDGKLVEITSSEDQTEVSKYITSQKPTSNNLWMGATNLQGKWMFLSSKNSDAFDSWTSWAPGFPVVPTREDPNNCGSLTQNSGWNWANVPCDYHMGALCYVQLREDDSDTIIG